MNKTIAALDFGTNKIITVVAELNGSQRCDIAGTGIAMYDGYLDNNWINPDALVDAINKSVQEAENQAGCRIREIYVGVPAAFSRVYTVEPKVAIQGADPKVSPKDVADLFSKAANQLGDIRGTVIHRSPAWFVVDDGKKTIEPTGMRGYELKGLVSFVTAEDFFIRDVTERLRALDIGVDGFFSTPAGQAMLYISEDERDRKTVLVDMGYLVTEVMILEGDAITFMKAIPLGGGHIAADLAIGLSIPLTSAEEIKRNYVYGITAGQEEFVTTDIQGSTVTFKREEVERVLEPRAEEICESVRDAIDSSGIKLGNWSAVYFTGGGMAINRGGREYLAAKINRTVRELPRKTVKMSSPAYSSALGLVDLVISTVKSSESSNGIGGFFRNLFGGN